MTRSIILVLIIFGGVFITSELFKDVQNDPKTYFILISITIYIITCFVSRKGIQQLFETLQSHVLLYGIVVVCMLTSIHGLLQYFGLFSSNHSAFPITGSFENPAGFAAVQAAMFPFVLTKCIDRDNGILLRVFLIVVSLACFSSVILSGSRTGFLSLFSVVIVVMAFDNKLLIYFKTRKWLWIPSLVLMVSLSVLLYYVKQDSADGRVFVWKRCFELIKERLLFGYGVSGFHRFYMSTQANFFRIHPDSHFVMLADNISHPFNEFLKLTINYGLLGLSIAIAILVWIVWRLFKSEKQSKVLGLSFISSLFIMCLFSYPYRYSIVWLLSFVAIAPGVFKSRNNTQSIPIFFRYIILILLFFILGVNIRAMYYDMKWSEISKRSLSGKTEQMLKYYEEMKPIMEYNPLFLYNYAAELSYVQRYEESLEITSQCAELWNDYDVQKLFANNYINLGMMEEAIQSYEQAYYMIPCRFEPLYGMMMVYKDCNDTINALRIADEIIEKQIKVSSNSVTYIIEKAKQIISEY